MGHLRSEAGSPNLEISLDRPTSLREALAKLPENVKSMVLSRGGELHPGLLVLVNGADLRSFKGGEVLVDDSDVVTIIPAIHGGSP